MEHHSNPSKALRKESRGSGGPGRMPATRAVSGARVGAGADRLETAFAALAAALAKLTAHNEALIAERETLSAEHRRASDVIQATHDFVYKRPMPERVDINTIVSQAATLTASETRRGGIARRFYSTKKEGTGMGLALSRSILEAHGGRLWAENNTGGGATFRVTLPVGSRADA